ncbi:response regulator transcription factor [Clostridium sp. NSJ-49]|uniref:Stage 0 sporulation protein A homolog n=1 Tax=Clostridium disporicum TaxID=84024 RepID=A0A174ICM1_9CLOT|nr:MULTISPECIES: response regulator transcription factor [Clostridium]MBC5625808.1 response regulator transcription factor [Clostridium sp. NSJ-49]MCD2500919.1 response regulator transcription factor [Clostridium sp. NSJ-145]MDU6341231.1 response regulator transcription factor [Clostridium sp.]CUO84211.1 LuxR family DNA-binding response regulator [Clostridium disporicum]
MEKIKILIVDDDSLIRESLKIILSSDDKIEVLSTASNGQEAVDYCIKNSVDIALVDIRMPLVNGVKATKEITKRTNTKVIILTTFDEDEYIKEALNYGAKGYLLKNTSPRKIIETIKVVSSGNCVIQEEVLNKITDKLLKVNNKSEKKIDTSLFTERELNIMEAIADGLTNKEISKKLFISEGTVKNYITSILDKTDLEHRTQIAIYYIKGK